VQPDSNLTAPLSPEDAEALFEIVCSTVSGRPFVA
jgi:hypothetical protein